MPDNLHKLPKRGRKLGFNEKKNVDITIKSNFMRLKYCITCDLHRPPRCTVFFFLFFFCVFFFEKKKSIVVIVVIVWKDLIIIVRGWDVVLEREIISFDL